MDKIKKETETPNRPEIALEKSKKNANDIIDSKVISKKVADITFDCFEKSDISALYFITAVLIPRLMGIIKNVAMD